MNDDRSEHKGDVLRQVPSSDILNPHWVAGFFEDISFFRKVPPLTLQSFGPCMILNPFTGRCHFDGGVASLMSIVLLARTDGLRKTGRFSDYVGKRKNEAFARVGANMMHIGMLQRRVRAEAPLYLSNVFVLEKSRGE
jgi:hypothetical protein